MTSTISVSTGRPERVDTPLGIFEFRHLRTDLLFGYRMIDLGGQNALVATPEKALLDLLYLQPGGDSTAYLNELRLQNTEQLDTELLRKQSEKFGTAKLLKAAKVISGMIARKKDEFEDLLKNIWQTW